MHSIDFIDLETKNKMHNAAMKFAMKFHKIKIFIVNVIFAIKHPKCKYCPLTGKFLGLEGKREKIIC